MLSTTGSSPSSSSTNIVEKTSPTGTWLANTLRPRHPEPTVDRRRRPARPGEVGAAGRDEDDALVGDAAQRGLGTGQSPPVAPRREQRDVMCIADGERASIRSAWPARAGPSPPGGSWRPRPPSSLGDGDRQVARRAAEVEGLGHEGAVAVVARRRTGRSRRRAPRPRRRTLARRAARWSWSSVGRSSVRMATIVQIAPLGRQCSKWTSAFARERDDGAVSRVRPVLPGRARQRSARRAVDPVDPARDGARAAPASTRSSGACPSISRSLLAKRLPTSNGSGVRRVVPSTIGRGTSTT